MDARTSSGPAEGSSGSRVIHYDGADWDGIPVQAYKPDPTGPTGPGVPDPATFRGITRRLLASPEAAGFEVRYFEVSPGGYSSHERHEHVHVVLCLRGRGSVRLGGRTEPLAFGDVVYVAPGDPHQFRNEADEPFGFLCIVDRERDRPVPVGR